MKNSAYNLTKRELAVLALLIKGCTNSEIGKLLKIKNSTVKAHISSIYKKLNETNRIRAAIKAVLEGILQGVDFC